jgi:hypothetical protein
MPLLLNAVKSKYKTGGLRSKDAKLRFGEILPLVQKLKWGFTSLAVFLPFKKGKKLMLRDRIRVLHFLKL